MYVFAVKCITYIYLLTTYIGVVLREKVHSHSLEKVGRFRKAKKMKLHAQTCTGHVQDRLDVQLLEVGT